MIFDYVKLEFEELKDLLFINLVLSLLFSITFIRFSHSSYSLFNVFFSFFIFLFLLLVLRLLFMKFIAYKNGFKITLKLTYFDRYYLRNYDRITYTTNSMQSKLGIKEIKKFKGIPTPFVGVLLYILTLGLLIFPSYWIYKKEKIPHLHLGKKMFYEKFVYFDVTEYRYSKVLFAGFLFYFIFGFFLKAFYQFFDINFYNGFVFSMYWIAFVTIIPIMGTEGYELFTRHKFMWTNILTILILGMLSLLVFEKLIYIIGVTIISFLMIFTVIVWRELMEK